ncbi:MAG: bifunctional lysylphosphatidylglycerol flippase/synthetase MprF [Bacteroidales bacterium]|jgi:phosphatidylglycerol lysyltransferase|nr:bifunctional lysylphosphatidylglycerol flippase/synthetase MprF [Bacteroidales bacterium]
MKRTGLITGSKTGPLSSYYKNRVNPFLRENGRIIAQSIFTLLFIGLGIWFITHERAELVEVKNVLTAARWQWVLAGTGLTIIYILLQGQMYVYSFATIRNKVSLMDSTVLFIKRNFISVFLPAGGISSLAFFTGPIECKGIKGTQIHFASSIYAFVGILSVVIVAVPAFIFAVTEGTIGSGELYALVAIFLLIFLLVFAYRSLIKKGGVYTLLVKLIPASEVFLDDLQNNRIDRKNFLLTIVTSVLIEFVGIAHLYIAMITLNFEPSFFAAVMGYIISVIFLIVSPFLRGLGPVEVSMTYILIRFGFGNVEAIAVVLLYRFFEFWMPLIAGVLAFLSKLNKLLMRVLPALFLMGLGILNIVSVLTPAISERLIRLKDFLPVGVIHASNYLVMTAGLFLLVTAAFMLKGMRTAWWFALFLSILSFIGHITKAIDYEEAIVALIVVVVLIITRKEYYIKSNPKLRNIGIQTSLLFTVAILTYGIVGFYFLDKKHFNIDFDLFQSIRFTLQNYFLIGSSELVPADSFARNFLYSINISGFLSIAFLIYTLVRSYKAKKNVTDEEFSLAKNLMNSYGNSSLDYFKTYSDKMLFFSADKKAFIAYRISGNFAVALENPVAENSEEMERCIRGFDAFCYENGLKSIFYRVPEESLEIYHKLHRKDLFLGQEGIVDLSTFTMEGGTRKSLRNAINKVTDRGFKATVHIPPVHDNILQKIKSVSDAWLEDTDRTEIVFSQGMFVWDELKQQTIITVENAEEKIVAFLNTVPDYAKNEATYDLIRKTKDAPNGVMDFILIELFNYLKSRNFRYVNLGFAPLSGLDDPHTFPERSMKFAYEKIRSFSHYKGLREYKEKFEPVWYNKYLIYQHDYDLLRVPAALANVIKS